MFENAVTYQFIGNVTNGATDDTTLGINIADGSVALVEVSTGKVQESDMTSNTAKYKIVSKNAAGQIIQSPEFDMSKATITGASYDGGDEQISFWGYNGSSGDLGTITSGNTYTLTFDLLHFAPGVGTTPLRKTIPFTATAATQYNVALGLANSFDRVFGREPYDLIKCELVNDESGTDTSGGVFSVTEGSNVVTTVESSGAAGDAGNYDSDGSEIAVGDLIRFSAASEDTGDPVYKVTAVSGISTASASITLDRKYQGSTDASVAANTVSVVDSANEGNYGLKFTGLDRFANTGFDPTTDFYSKVRFSISSDDFDSDVEHTEDTVADEGTGTAYEVAQLEHFAAKNEGLGRVNSAYPATKTRSETDLSTPNTYDTMIIDAYNNSMVDVATGISPVSKFRIVIRTEESLNGDAVDAALGLSL